MSFLSIVLWALSHLPTELDLIKQIIALFHSMPQTIPVGKAALTAAVQSGSADAVKSTMMGIVAQSPSLAS